MPTITHTTITDHIAQTPVESWPAVTLIFGEELLCKRAYDAVLNHLVPEAEREAGVELFDGGEESLGSVLASMNTYALLSSAKVVVLHAARLFYSTKARQGLREKMIEAGEKQDFKKAARPLLNLMALDGLQMEDLERPAQRRKLVEDVEGTPPTWFAQLLAYCQEKKMRVPEKSDDADLLMAAMEKGFPAGHRLLITTDLVDRRKALFKAIAEQGMAVDCAVPKGESRADRQAQEAVMQAMMEQALGQAGKKLAGPARQRLLKWTGFDLRTLQDNLEKLIQYVGTRQTISEADVGAVLQRTRKDPIFEFTNALAERDLPAMLFFVQNLLADGMHPLQLLSASANQLRRLLLAKDYIVGQGGRSWQSNMGFPQFKGAAFAGVTTYDESLAHMEKQWDATINPEAKPSKRKKVASDLVLARNPKSPFPVYQTLKKADNYSLDELVAAVCALSDVDRRMKSTGQDPRLLLERFLMELVARKQAAALRAARR